MNCDLSNEYMMKYFDGEKNEIEEAKFKQHLKTCRKCCEEYKSMQEIFSALEVEEGVEPPDGFEASVMEKVDKIAAERSRRMSGMLVVLYNTATIVSIILLMVFVADLKQGGVMNAIESLKSYFGSFSNVVSAVFGVSADIFRLLTGALQLVFQVALSIIKSYYQVFIGLTLLLLAIQRLYNYVAASDGRKTQ